MKKTLSEAHKRKISESMKATKNHAFGKPLTSEHKYKIRLSMLQYWKNIKYKNNNERSGS
jgi:hypothetical protein